MKYRAALVDFDGTLADSMPWWLDLPRQTLIEEGIPEPEDFSGIIRRLTMREVAVWMAEQYPHLVRDRTLRERWESMMERNYLKRISLKPGAKELLSLLREAGLTVVILSATRRPLLDTALEHFGLLPRVDRIYCEEETGSKRTEKPYLFLEEELGVSRSEMLLIEDAPLNIAAAAEQGLGTVGVYEAVMAAWQEDIRSAADVYLRDFSDLSAVRALLQRS